MQPVGERLPLEGTRNTRDIGGYRTTAGQTVRRGVVFRSDGIDCLTGADVDALCRAGIRTVLDFRSAPETARPNAEPSPIRAAGVPVRTLPLFDEEDAKTLFFAPIAPGAHPLEPYYRSILTRHAPNVRAALEHLAAPESLPAIVHCSAGKDRTGVIVALLLAVAGVPSATICDDYARTGEYLDAAWVATRRQDAAKWGVPWDRYVLAYESPPTVMASTLAYITETAGDVSGYLTSIGVQADVVARLREHLTGESELASARTART